MIAPQLFTSKFSELFQRFMANYQFNRRSNTRVRFPCYDLSKSLPKIYYRGHELSIQDISAGGLCLLDQEQHLKHVRQTELDMHFGDQVIQQTVEILDHGHKRRHLRFIDPSASLQVLLHCHLKSGYIGTRIEKAHMIDHIQIAERWMGLTGERIEILRSSPRQTLLAEARLLWTSIHIPKDGYPIYAETHKTYPGQKISEHDFMQMMVILTNIQQPSDHLKRLLAHLDEQVKAEQLKKTQTTDQEQAA